jgi:hypothetical protein
MKVKPVLLSMLSTVLVLTPFASLQNAKATSVATETKANLIARGGGAAGGAVDAAGSLATVGVEIQKAVVQAKNRHGFVRQVMEVAAAPVQGKYNVLVFNTSQPYENRLGGVQRAIPVNYAGVPYVVWIFKNGTFVNKGDGGYINWAFKGNFKRSGKQGHTVNFY